MKIRQGFVSNSSSSSFCMYGVELSHEDMKQFISDDIDTTKSCWHYDLDWYDVTSEINKKFGEDFSFEYDGESCECFYIGKTLKSLKDDETGKDFKESVDVKVKEFFGKEKSCHIYNEVIYG